VPAVARATHLIFLILIILSAAARPGLATSAEPGPPGGPGDLEVGEILAGMTLEDKVGQLFIVYHSPPGYMAEHGFGGSLVFASMVAEPDSLRASLALAQQLCRMPLLVAVDQEGGNVNRLASLPGLEQTPTPRAMAGLDAAALDSVLAPQAAALRDLGINLNLAPVVDPALDHLGKPTLMGRRERAFGATAGEIVPAARAFLHSYGRRDIGGILKHFPGYDVAQNSDEELAVSGADTAAIGARIEVFAAVMDGAAGVMMSSIRFPAVSDLPAVLDPGWVARARCGHNDRIVMTDDLWGHALRAWVSGVHEVDPIAYPDEDLRRLVLLAFDAGNDMLMVTYPQKAVRMKAVLVEVIGSDPGRQAELDIRVGRLLKLKGDLGLLGR
jgi:beta-N-acetylhexosaminidase